MPERRAFLIKEIDGKYYSKRVRIEKNPDVLKGLMNDTRWKILELIAEKPRYPSEIARILKQHEQKVYYHIRQLEKAGLVRVVAREERGGSIAKYYGIVDHAFAFELPHGETRIAEMPIREQDDKTKQFLYPFIQGGKINARIVVGSPDPHGPYQVRARDGHYAADLAFFLGQYGEISEEFLTMLDIDVKAEKKTDHNLIVVGGPLTNVITQEINHYLPSRFQTETYPFRGIKSGKTHQVYLEDNTGIIAKIASPYARDSYILLLAGNRVTGTKAAVIALTRHTREVLEDYHGEDNWVRIVNGLDMDGDGKVDSIEILE